MRTLDRAKREALLDARRNVRVPATDATTAHLARERALLTSHGMIPDAALRTASQIERELVAAKSECTQTSEAFRKRIAEVVASQNMVAVRGIERQMEAAIAAIHVKTVMLSDELAELEVQVADQLVPGDDPAELQKRREDELAGRVDIVDAPHLIDRITTSRFIHRLLTMITQYAGVMMGTGTFLDLGSGPATANVVMCVWAHYRFSFSGIVAVDLEQNVSTMATVAALQRRVIGIPLEATTDFHLKTLRQNGGDIQWWTVRTEEVPTKMVTAFTGQGTRRFATDLKFAEADVIYSCDKAFKAAAVDRYRVILGRSLKAHSRMVVYMTTHPVGPATKIRDLGYDEVFEPRDAGTSDPHIGSHIYRIIKVLAKGRGVDVAWEDTVYYLVFLQGSSTNTSTAIEHALGAADTIETTAAVHTFCAKFGGIRTDDATFLEPTEDSSRALLTALASNEALREHDANAEMLTSMRIIGGGRGMLAGVAAILMPFASDIVSYDTSAERHIDGVRVMDAYRRDTNDTRVNAVTLAFHDPADSFTDLQPTHIIFLDAYMDDAYRERVFARINATSDNFLALVCCTQPRDLKARGWPMASLPIKLVHKLRLSARGGRSFTAYYYVHADVDE